MVATRLSLCHSRFKTLPSPIQKQVCALPPTYVYSCTDNADSAQRVGDNHEHMKYDLCFCVRPDPPPPSGSAALREPWPPVQFASTSLYLGLSLSILLSPSPVSPLEHRRAAVWFAITFNRSSAFRTSELLGL